jgi:succinyl-CoA synthetase beta subunit
MNIRQNSCLPSMACRSPKVMPAHPAGSGRSGRARLAATTWVVKCQVHAGGRGKAGGVKLAKSKDEIRAFAQNWLGKQPGDLSDRRQRPAGHQDPGRVLHRHRQGALSGRRGRSWQRRVVFMASHRRWCGYREDRPRDPGRSFTRRHRSAGGRRPIRPASSPSSSGLVGDQIKQFTKIFMGLGQMFLDKRLRAAGRSTRW